MYILLHASVALIVGLLWTRFSYSFARSLLRREASFVGKWIVRGNGTMGGMMGHRIQRMNSLGLLCFPILLNQ